MPEALDRMVMRFHQLLEGRWLSPSRVFAMADENADGLVSYNEFSLFLKQLGVAAWWAKHGQDLFKRFDRSGDGVIDLNELEEAMTKVVSRANRKRTSRTPALTRKVDRQARLVALVAHRDMRGCLVHFVEQNLDFFCAVPLLATTGTAKALRRALGLQVDKKVTQGSLGGDQAIAAMLCEDKIAAAFVFKDPMQTGSASTGLGEILRLCDVYQVPYATNRASALGLFLSLQKFGASGDLSAAADDFPADLSTQRLPPRV